MKISIENKSSKIEKKKLSNTSKVQIVGFYVMFCLITFLLLIRLILNAFQKDLFGGFFVIQLICPQIPETKPSKSFIHRICFVCYVFKFTIWFMIFFYVSTKALFTRTYE